MTHEEKITKAASTPLRYSRLKHIAQSPAHYLHSLYAEHTDSWASRIGRGAHAMVLGTPVFHFKGADRRSRDYREFATDAEAKSGHKDGAVILTSPEHAICAGIYDSVMSNPVARATLTGTREETVNWTLQGRACTGTPDCYNDDVLSDLKTTGCAEPVKFSRHCRDMGYPGQLAFYETALGRTFGDHLIVAVENKAPYVCVVIRIPFKERIEAHEQVKRMMDRLLECEATGNYPGYADSIVELVDNYRSGANMIEEREEQ